MKKSSFPDRAINQWDIEQEEVVCIKKNIHGCKKEYEEIVSRLNPE